MTRAQEGLEAKVADLLSRADHVALGQVWEIGQRISELGGQDDTLARAIHGKLGERKDGARLAAAAALQELTDSNEFGKEIFDALEPVFSSEQAEAAIAAMDLAGRVQYFSRRITPKLRQILSQKVGSDLVDPLIRIAAAKALWKVGSPEDQIAAKAVMTQFLLSRERRLRVHGALALAEINAAAAGPARRILLEVAKEPTAEGRLASSHLRIEEQRRTFDARLTKLSDREPAGSGDNTFDKLHEILRRVRSHHVRGNTFSEERLLDNAAKGILRALDRHSSYLTSDEYKKFYFDLNPEYGGIGAYVNFDRDDVFSIVRPIYSGPAYEANLRSGDKILEVDGWETVGRTSEEIIAKLKGEPGTKVTIKIFRRGWDGPKEFTIARRKIQVPSVSQEMLPGQVGYIEIISFAANTSRELGDALASLKKQGAKGLVLDLRNNTGGYLLAAKQVVEQFVTGKKVVVVTRGRIGPDVTYSTGDVASTPKLPLAVIINGYSASASEITAGALQDHGRAVVVGERSYGKGSVQSLLPLIADPPETYTDGNHNDQRDEWEDFKDRNKNDKYDIGPRMKLTIAYYYLPSGRCVHKQIDEDGKILDPDWGVRPEREVQLREYSAKEAWKASEIYDLLEKNVFQDYVSKHIKENKALFVELAEGDNGDSSRYPEFEEFYKGLDTKLTKDDVRRWLRYTMRDRVADLRGKAFPGGRAWGDYQEDAQLQEAVRVVLEKNNQDIRKITAYKDVLKISFEAKAAKKNEKDSNKDG